MIMLAMLLGLFMLPVFPGAGADVRGNGEMFPLNGPCWSLFFEYIGNILYALALRRLSTRTLSIIVGVMGMGLAIFSVGNGSGYGHMGVGWTMADNNLTGGLLRLGFSLSCGLLLSRMFRPVRVRGAFWICSIILLILFAIPHVGGKAALWQNGLYDAACILFVFPALVWLAASGKTTDRASSGVCKFLGDISYPVYIIHYPFMYYFYAWVWDNGLTFSDTWPVQLLLFFGNIALAYFFLKMYDEPVRRWLSRKFLGK